MDDSKPVAQVPVAQPQPTGSQSQPQQQQGYQALMSGLVQTLIQGISGVAMAAVGMWQASALYCESCKGTGKCQSCGTHLEVKRGRS